MFPCFAGICLEDSVNGLFGNSHNRNFRYEQHGYGERLLGSHSRPVAQETQRYSCRSEWASET